MRRPRAQTRGLLVQRSRCERYAETFLRVLLSDYPLLGRTFDSDGTYPGISFRIARPVK